MTRSLRKPIARDKRNIFPFLELPAEIRNMVYKLAIADYIGPMRKRKDILWLDVPYVPPPVSYLNRQTLVEALPLLLTGGDKHFCADFTETCDRGRVVHRSFRSWFKCSNTILQSVLIRVDLGGNFLHNCKEISVKYGEGKLSFECNTTLHRSGQNCKVVALIVKLEHEMRSTRNAGIGLQELEIIRKILVSEGCIEVPERT